MDYLDLTKGMRVHAAWLQHNPGACVSGSQLKIEASDRMVTGTVTHIRGNDPIAPTSVRVWIRPDEGGEEVVVKPEWIRGRVRKILGLPAPMSGKFVVKLTDGHEIWRLDAADPRFAHSLGLVAPRDVRAARDGRPVQLLDLDDQDHVQWAQVRSGR
jgi:hypothetical protein